MDTNPGLPSLGSTIVIPCYNEEKRLAVPEFEHFLAIHPEIRLLFVNDGSKDNTLAVLRGLQARFPNNTDVLNLERNQGKAEAVRAGLLRAISTPEKIWCTGYWDADLATPLSELVRLWQILSAHPEVVMLLGSRVRLMGRAILRQPARHYAGRFFATIASSVLRLPIYDTQCGAKLLRVTPIVSRALAAPFESKWAFDVELLARLLAFSGDASGQTIIYEEPLSHWRDVDGSKLTMQDSIKAILDLLRVRRTAATFDRTTSSLTSPSDAF